jgi:uroporphyrinogen decarboxylase
MGGSLAAFIAAQYPERVERLALLAPSGYTGALRYPGLYGLILRPGKLNAWATAIARSGIYRTLFPRSRALQALSVTASYGPGWVEALARMIARAKAHGRQMFLHTCGHNTPIIPDLIEIGLDILHPIQPEAMDIAALKREYGRDITFCGGVRTQDLLPLGTPEEVRAEVRRLKQVMGAGGGYILEPGITLQADVPLANLVALVEEAMK